MASKIVVYGSYLQMIKNSVGTRIFRNLYLMNNGKKIDATKNGDLSCAFFVSNILLIWDLISGGHATVEATTKDMEKSGWEKIPKEKIRPGDVIVWEKKLFVNGKRHFHNGFYIGNKKAISNDSKKKMPVIHSWDYNGKRKIVSIYAHPKLND
ncbi:MAG: hypothetical protein A2V69_00510 [Candidatus Portnoybacteria bacterium RBG_13_40_8]|uniref:Uncharacterized protein n=1 Tax=Candidatus Portnoybacteria bacterium RBG_13_40_8 TaxID=1801990 RepID=A0A1G2F295_9BACT|nr:MAG: hypothetical protein A2V69_00510 [Candidatus Portnoybacteria bacterium RBG_13_40_8]